MIKSRKGLIVKNEDGSEQVNYDVQGFPSYCFNGWIDRNSYWTNIPHFHEDVEICAVREGSIGYVVNGKLHIVSAGETIIINSGNVHYSTAVQDERAYYTIIVIHPNLLCSSLAVERKAVLPVTQNKDIDTILFKNDCKIGKKMFTDCLKMHNYVGDEFRTTMQFYKIWENILKSCEDLFKFSKVSSNADPHLESFKNMLSYIRNNYTEKITLDEIANAGNVSRTLCNTIFNKYTSQSPFDELLRYRCQKVCELLESSSMNITEIANITGFSSSTYLTEVFKKHYGASPREYRKKFPLE